MHHNNYLPLTNYLLTISTEPTQKRLNKLTITTNNRPTNVRCRLMMNGQTDMAQSVFNGEQRTGKVCTFCSLWFVLLVAAAYVANFFLFLPVPNTLKIPLPALSSLASCRLPATFIPASLPSSPPLL